MSTVGEEKWVIEKFQRPSYVTYRNVRKMEHQYIGEVGRGYFRCRIFRKIEKNSNASILRVITHVLTTANVTKIVNGTLFSPYRDVTYK